MILRVVVVAVVAGFAIGSVNPGHLLARSRGIDLREAGSGNPGATNAGRVLGLRWGVLVGVLDALKGFLPTLLTLQFAGPEAGLAAGLGVVLGHMFSPVLRGRGGKGVATTLGALLAVAPALAALILVVFLVVLPLVRVVGEASVLATLALVLISALSAFGVAHVVSPLVGAWALVLGLLVLARHRANLLTWWRRALP